MNKKEFCLRGWTFKNTLKSKQHELFKVNVQLREEYLRLRLKWTGEIGNKEVLILLSVKLIENLNLRDWSSTRRLNGQIKINFCGELEWEIDSSKKVSQKMPRNWGITKNWLCRTRRELDNKSLMNSQRKRKWIIFLQWISCCPKFRNYRTRSFFEIRKNSTIFETASSSGVSHVPSQPLRIPSPRGMICRDSCLPHNTRHSMDTSGNVFEDLPAPEGRSPSFFENPMNSALSSCGLISGNTGSTMRRRRSGTRAAEFSNTDSSFYQESWNLGTFMSYWRNVFSKLYDGCSEVFYCILGIPRLEWLSMLESQIFRPMCVWTHLALNSQCRGSTKWSWQDQQTILWRPSQIEGKHFPAFEMLDAKMASAMRKIIFNTSFNRTESVLKSSELKYKIGSWEEDKLLTWSLTTFKQPELMMQLKAYQICWIFAYIMMTFKISTQDGTKFC